MADYKVEHYWDTVAENISERSNSELIAGDDDPYYKYKREMFLKIFRTLPFEQRKVIEIGSGPGGNLAEVAKKQPLELWGADVSENMLDLSRRLLGSTPVNLKKTNGVDLDFTSGYFDIAFTSTVLQHNTDEALLKKLIAEICRVTGSDIYLFERTEKVSKGHESNIGRPVSFYEQALSAHGFKLKQTSYLNIQVSYFVCGAIRKIFNSKNRHEGEKISRISYWLEFIALPVTRILDKIVPQKRDLTMMHFSRAVN